MFCLSMFCLLRVFAFLCFVVLCFVIDLGKTGRILGCIHPDFALIKLTKVLYLIVLMQSKYSFWKIQLFNNFVNFIPVNFHTSI